jgi:hypothetical protein
MSIANQGKFTDVDMSWRLFILYISLFFASAIGAFLCTILVYLLKRYDVFHINFRTILWNMLTCILVNNLVQMMRPILLLLQYVFGSNERRRVSYRIQ